MRAPFDPLKTDVTQPNLRPALARSREETRVWALLRILARRAHTRPIVTPTAFEFDASGRLQQVAAEHAWIVARPDLQAGWFSRLPIAKAASELLDLYMPLCVGARSARLTLAHLGQSADGHVSTLSSASKFITGAADIRHTHRLRALFDAVLVGASTIAIDDPMLTTRLVKGANPARVILDPQARLPVHHTVFCDRAARTLVVIEQARRGPWPEHIETLGLPVTCGEFDLRQVLLRLRELGLARIFIEGGGVTIARFARARLLDHLQLAIAPVALGQGPAIDEVLTPHWLTQHALRLRSYKLGADTLLDAELRRIA